MLGNDVQSTQIDRGMNEIEAILCKYMYAVM